MLYIRSVYLWIKEIIMSSVSRDPDKAPNIDPRLIDKARKCNMQIAHIICDENGAKVGDPVGVSFVALVPAIPRIGEQLHLQNKTRCTVRQIDWSIATAPDGLLRIFPNVYAERVKEQDDQE